MVNNIARFTVPFINGKNQLIAKSTFNTKEYTDQMEVDFRLVPNTFAAHEDNAIEFNVLLGSNRMFEDKVNSQIWIPEKEYTTGSWGYLGGEPNRPKTKYGSLPSSDLDILGAKNDPIYQTQRLGIESFKADVPDGKYMVTLHWAELESDTARELVYNLGNDIETKSTSERIFNVLINDNYVEKNMNLAAWYGEARAVVKKYEIVVLDGEGISIDFKSVKGIPVLNAFQIRKSL